MSFIYFKEMKFKKAWKYFDGRLEEDNFIYKNNSYNLIKDKLLNQKIIDPKKQLLIIREQGVGDEILYGSMYKNILENFKNTYIETDERLINLFVKVYILCNFIILSNHFVSINIDDIIILVL